MSIRHLPSRAARRFAALALATALGLTACGGGGSSGDAGGVATTPAAPVVADTLPVVTASARSATVVMPAGASLTADKLTVVTSVESATPAAGGAVTFRAYDNGAQLAIALTPAGNPMMMGWIDATHATISAATTADVLAYFALNGQLMASEGDRQALINGMPAAPGITAVEAAVASALGSNVEAFATRNSAVTVAVAGFAMQIFSDSRKTRAAAGRAHALGVLITPQEQSGINVLQDPPFAAHLTNSFRRRGFAFVDRVSHTSGGVDVTDAAPVTSFEVPPVGGVNGGVTGAINDIVNAYYGTQPTAYADVSAPDGGFAVPLVAGSDKTTYQVTVVGPGAFAGTSASLTAAQTTALNDVAIRGFVKDFMVPTLTNFVLGSGKVDFTAGQSTAQAGFFADVLASVTSDFIGFLPTVPGLSDKIVKGQWFDAAADITGTTANLGTIRTILIEGFSKATKNAAAAGLKTGPLEVGLKAFNNILNAGGGVLQVFDSSVYVRDLAYAERAAQWSVVVNAAKISLNPPSTTIDTGGTVLLTTNVSGVGDTAGYSYHWSTTTAIGELNEFGGSSRTHQSDYCSSSPKALYAYKDGAAASGTDTITVEVYSGSSCDPAKGERLGSTTATVTLQRTNGYSLYGGPGGYDCGVAAGGAINSDDSLTVYLNGSQVFFVSGTYCGGGVSSIALPGAKKGDIVRVVVGDEKGHHAGLSGLYMLHEGKYVQVDPGFNKATPDGADNGIQYDHSFAIPF